MRPCCCVIDGDTEPQCVCGTTPGKSGTKRGHNSGLSVWAQSQYSKLESTLSLPSLENVIPPPPRPCSYSLQSSLGTAVGESLSSPAGLWAASKDKGGHRCLPHCALIPSPATHPSCAAPAALATGVAWIERPAGQRTAGRGGAVAFPLHSRLWTSTRELGQGIRQN